MPLHILAIGSLRAGPERDLAERYIKRATPLAKRLGFGVVQLRAFPESRKATPALRQRDEAAHLTSALPRGAVVFVCDEAGEAVGSAPFAQHLQRARGQSADLAFILGGPDGLADDLLTQARHVIAFGRLTWPHQLARIMLTEQIYRALTLLSGHPYHRE